MKEIKKIPTTYLSGDIDSEGRCYNFLVLELLRPSVEDFFKNKLRYSEKVIYQIGFQILQIVKKVRKKWNFDLMNELGSEGYGNVYRGIHTISKKEFAV